MLIIIEKYPIDASIFCDCSPIDDLNLVCLTCRLGNQDREITLPILFESHEDTRRFYEGYKNALNNDAPAYEFTGEAWFSPELYHRLHYGKTSNH